MDTSDEKQPNIAIPIPVKNAIRRIHVNLVHPEKAMIKKALILGSTNVLSLRAL